MDHRNLGVFFVVFISLAVIVYGAFASESADESDSQGVNPPVVTYESVGGCGGGRGCPGDPGVDCDWVPEW